MYITLLTVARNEEVNGMSTAAAVRDHISRRGAGRFHRPRDFPGNRNTVEQALGRMCADDELIRIRKGLYWRGPGSPFGMIPPSIDQVLAAIAPGRAFGPASYAAANLLHLTTQVPWQPIYAVSGWTGRAPAGIRLMVRSGDRGRGRDRARLNPYEVAILEVLADGPDVTEVDGDSAAQRLAEAIRSAPVRPSALAAAAPTEPPRARARLRHLLGTTGHPDLADRIPPGSRPEIDAHAIRWLTEG
jgi:hypothetical protein